MPIYNFGITYRSGEKVSEYKNFTSIDISELKKLFTMARSKQCHQQLEDWYFWNATLETKAESSDDIIISKDGNSLRINTDRFDLNETLYLKNVLHYGKKSFQTTVQINIHVGGCQKVRVKFDDEVPKTRAGQYEIIKGKDRDYPIQVINKMTS
jgi:hypothetical protein